MQTIEHAVAMQREALGRFVSAARSIPVERWNLPRAAGKWSARQVMEHVVLSYERTRQMELGTFSGPSMPWYARWIGRDIFLPLMFRKGSWIGGPTTGPDFLRPSDTLSSFDDLLGRLEAASLALEHDLAASPGGKPLTLYHPIFGRVSLSKMLRFLAIHADHHRPQLAS